MKNLAISLARFARRLPLVVRGLAVLLGASAVVLCLAAQSPKKPAYDGPVVIAAGSEWIPLDVELDIEAGSALDFSDLVPWHTPAGAWGRVMINPAGRFAFASRPDTPVRFYGCNLCFSAHYISHEQADRLAERLRRIGYNAVRFHHYERDLVDRSKGNSTTFRPEAIDQLDYLFAALKKRGIYITTDLFVSRPVFADEVWEGEKGDVGMDNFKKAVLVNDRAFENFKTFTRNLIGRVNPYTGMTWAADPAFAWINLVNEGNAGNRWNELDGKVKEDFLRAWNRWLAARYSSREALAKALGRLDAEHDPAKGNVPLPTQLDSSPAGMQLALFFASLHRNFFAKTRKFLRDELGCNALLSDMNAWTNPLAYQAVRQAFDYVDDHFYVDHPQFIERQWRLPSRHTGRNPVSEGAPGGRRNAFTRLLDRPFTISEFNYSGPGRFRGVGGILTSALGAIQDWSAIWRFTYSHSRDNLFSAGTANYFDVASDPLNLAAERAAVCLFRRGDLSPARHTIAIAMDPKDLLDTPRRFMSAAPRWDGLALVVRVGTALADDPAKVANADLVLPLSGMAPAADGKVLALDPYDKAAEEKLLAELRKRGWLSAENPTDLAARRFRSETGELAVNSPPDVLTLDTPRTVGGYAPAGGRIETKAATIEIAESDATVWVSSLDGAPIGQSKRLLITHLTDLQNSEARYLDKARTVLAAWGRLPHLVRKGTATITVRVGDAGKAKVYRLSTGGRRLGEVKTTAKSGALIIPLDTNAGGKAQMLYEVALPM